MRNGGIWVNILICALKQLLVDQCLVLAHTGVGAEIIGGATYHSEIPLPMEDINHTNMYQAPKRFALVCEAIVGVKYMIIYEMFMVGRCALGHI